jgi:hypothetical protein
MQNPVLMVDLETLSTEINAAILSIGAIVFNPLDDGVEDCPTFYQTIAIESNEREGRHISGSTVVWWLRQSEEARAALVTDTLPLHGALMRFQQWMIQYRPIHCWANSPSFDCAILKHAFGQHNVHWPFAYWAERDLRTLKDAAYPNGDSPKVTYGTAHGALDDAIKQAILVQKCHAALRTRA